MDPADRPSPTRVTIRDLAKQLGLSHATVSMALRNNPKIAEKTRLLVNEQAARQGYRPEPMLAALAAYRQMKKPPIYHGTIAWLYNEVTNKILDMVPVFKLYYEGACSRANSLGFRIEDFHITKTDMSPSRMSDILLTRGVQGILLPPQVQANARLDMRWERFSTVTFGFSLSSPQLHMVGSTQYRIGMTATRKLQELGYERIGYCGSVDFDQRTDRNYSAGFHIASLNMPPGQRISPLIVDTELGFQTKERIRDWIGSNHIDAVVCSAGMQKVIEKAGYRFPDDFAAALLGSSWDDHPDYAGMDEQSFLIGVAAVDSVVGMIQRGERGVPEIPYRLMIEGKWRDGNSAPPAIKHRSPGPGSSV